MRKTFLTTVLTALLALPSGVAAQDLRYRVEVIVLTHLGHAETPHETAAPRDYGDALDFLAPATETPADATDDEPAAAADDPVDVPADGADPASAEDGIEEEEPAVVHIEELGDVMQDAWRRLRLSGPFRPLVSLAWEQPAEPPFPEVRVHDENVVLVEDPWASIRERLEAGEDVDAWIQAGLVPPLPPVDPERLAAQPEDDPAAAIRAALPPPRRFYALDGAVTLERSRFLHLEVDLQQREAVYTQAPEQAITLPRGLRTMPAALPAGDEDAAESQPRPSAFRVFDMAQRRQVRTGQVEYFDGPVLSLLAYVTAIEPPPADD